jgi:sugar/nucleoside kinase (ribokinase family)
VDAVAIRARCGVPEVLVTFGEIGAAVSSDEGSGQASSQAVSGVDPTGAGDAFLASYAYARVQGRPPLDAARTACESVSALLAGRARSSRA